MFGPRCVVIVSLGKLFIKLFIQEFHFLSDFDSTFVFDITVYLVTQPVIIVICKAYI